VYGTTLNVFRPTVFSENLMVFHCSKPSYCIKECWIWANFKCDIWSCSLVHNYRYLVTLYKDGSFLDKPVN